MRHTLTVEIVDAGEDLLEAALDFRGRHATSLDRGVQITARAKLHNFAPMRVLVLHKINRLDDVDVM